MPTRLNQFGAKETLRVLIRNLTAACAVTAIVCALVGVRVGVAVATPQTSHYVKHKTKHTCATQVPVGRATCFAIRQTDTREPGALEGRAVAPHATPSGYGPSTLLSAYKLSPAAGNGRRVAIVDAYNDPNAAADLAAYRTQFGLPSCTVANGCFRQLNQNGAASPLPSNNTGWAGEEALDIEMVSAICPNCSIDLIEASSSTSADLYTAEDRAYALGDKFISNRWGGSETSSQTASDSHPLIGEWRLSSWLLPGGASTPSGGGVHAPLFRRITRPLFFPRISLRYPYSATCTRWLQTNGVFRG